MNSNDIGIIMLCVICLVPFVAGVLITRAYFKGTLVPGFLKRLYERIKYGE